MGWQGEIFHRENPGCRIRKKFKLKRLLTVTLARRREAEAEVTHKMLVALLVPRTDTPIHSQHSINRPDRNRINSRSYQLNRSL